MGDSEAAEGSRKRKGRGRGRGRGREKAGAVEKETLLHRMGLGREAIVTKVMVRSNLMENQKGQVSQRKERHET